MTGATRELARLIVPLDTSATAEVVLPWAALIARDRAMEVHLVTVWNPVAPVPGVGPGAPREQALAELTSYLKGVAAHPELTTAPVTYEVLEGEVAEAIARISKERPGTMLMLATHGEGGYQEAYIGSTTDRLLKQLHVPVLVIPARQGA